MKCELLRPQTLSTSNSFVWTHKLSQLMKCVLLRPQTLSNSKKNKIHKTILDKELK